MLNKLLSGADSIAVGGHIRPDGDCTGSCMGMYQYIREVFPEKQTDVYLEDIPDSYKFIKAAGDIRHEIPRDKVYDLFICLDCGDEDRLGFSLSLFQNAKKTLCIDHHISNREFADENYIFPDASSTSELVYDLIGKDSISKEVAEALYLGIIHDTGVFQYSCAAPSTFEAAAQLLRKGIDGPKIIEETFYEKTYAQNQILGKSILESILLMDGKCIASYITKKQLKFYGVDTKDLDGIVSQLRATKNVEVAIFMYELEEGLYKISLRSGNIVDVSKVAQYFQGGGHVKAAGCSMKGTPRDIINNLMSQIALQL